MIRVLHSVSYMHRAGVETMIMNYYRNVDRSKVQFDFLCNKSKPGDYDDEILNLGGNIYYGPGFGEGDSPEYMAFIKKLLMDNPNIKILHAHNGARQYYPLKAAKAAGLPVRIAHAHGTDIIHNNKYQMKMLLKSQLPQIATHFLGCGNEAGEFFYGKKCWENNGVLIKNAIDLDSFTLNETTRERMRAEHKLTGCHIIGHVGRFGEQKNHSRLLDIFACVHQKDDMARLIFIGNGELQDGIKQKARMLGIESSVMFLGLRSDVNHWYQAMDVFVMPSIFEGLPVSGIEAQASGLPCVFSDCVSEEASVTDRVVFLSLSDSNERWADMILSLCGLQRASMREKMIAARYDIHAEAKHLQDFYIRLAGEAYGHL